MSEFEHLVTRAVEGDKIAFEEIYKKTYKKVYFTCMSFLKNEHDSADVSQEVYVIVMKSIHNLNDKASFESWLSKITVNRCKDFLKKNRLIPVEDETLSDMVADEGEIMLPEDYVTHETKRRIIMDIMKNNLSDVLYQTVVLFYFNNMSVAEIAQLMDCPVGTVTSRLCIARAKIKKGVQDYEKKNDEKLYSVAFIPILARIFVAEANSMEPQNVCAQIFATTSQNIITDKVAKAGGKAMLNSLKAKIIAGVLTLTVVGGGIAAVVASNSDDKNTDKRIESVKEDDKEQNSTSVGEVVTNEVSTSSNESQTNAIAEDSTENTDYTAMAEDALRQIDEFFVALKAGDVDTVISMSYEDDEYYEYLVAMSEYDCTEKFLQTIYGDVKYCINEETVEDLAYYLEGAYRKGTNSVHVPMEYSLPLMMIFGRMYPAVFADGEVVNMTETLGNMISNENAFPVLEDIMSVIPMVKAPDFWITLPDENGEIKIFLSHVLGDLELDNLTSIDNLYVANFVYKRLNSFGDFIVGAGSKGFMENNAELVEIDRLLATKDFSGLETYLGSLTGNDYATKYGNTYGHYEELTESQKTFVDNFIKEKFEYQLIDYVVNKNGASSDGYRYGLFLLTFPILDDLEKRDIMLTNWYAENDVNEYEFEIVSGSFKPEDFEMFVYWYYQVIAYAKTYVE